MTRERLDQSGFLILTADGAMESSSIGGSLWMQADGFREAILAGIRELRHSALQATQIAFERAEVILTRLIGLPNVAVRFLAQITGRAKETKQVEQEDKLALLSPMQREVALLAVSGSTIPEIARHLKRSQETVRTHMREIYRRLDIASRVELVHTVYDT